MNDSEDWATLTPLHHATGGWAAVQAFFDDQRVKKMQEELAALVKTAQINTGSKPRATKQREIFTITVPEPKKN